MDKIAYEQQIKELQEKLKKMEEEYMEISMQRTKYLLVLNNNDLLDDIGLITDPEVICEEQLRKLKGISAKREFTQAEAKIFDILTLNLQRARGVVGNNKKGSKQVKALSDRELMDLLKDKQ